MNSQKSAGGGIRPRGIPSGNPHPVSPGPDFESGASANSTTPAKMLGKHDKSPHSVKTYSKTDLILCPLSDKLNKMNIRLAWIV